MKTIEYMIEHAQRIREHSPDQYKSLIRLWTQFSRGKDGGEFEPWNPITLREHYYKGWTDSDFTAVLKGVGEL